MYIKVRQMKPWITQEFIISIRNKEKLYRVAKINQPITSYKIFINKSNKRKNIHQAKKQTKNKNKQ